MGLDTLMPATAKRLNMNSLKLLYQSLMRIKWFNGVFSDENHNFFLALFIFNRFAVAGRWGSISPGFTRSYSCLTASRLVVSKELTWRFNSGLDYIITILRTITCGLINLFFTWMKPFESENNVISNMASWNSLEIPFDFSM